MKSKGMAMFSKISIPLLFLTFFFAATQALNAATIEYDLTIGYKTVNYTGREVRAMAING